MAELDLFLAGLFVVATVFVLVMANFVWGAVKTKLADTRINSSSYKIFSGIDRVFGFMDGAIIFVQVIIILFLIFSVFLIDSHPAFFVVSIFLLIISTFLGGIYSNVWEAFRGSTDINNTINTNFKKTNILMNNYSKIAIVVGFIFLIALYAKSQSGGPGR